MVSNMHRSVVVLSNIFLSDLSCFLLQLHRSHFADVITPPKYPEKVLFCGWRRDIHDMILVIHSCTSKFSMPPCSRISVLVMNALLYDG